MFPFYLVNILKKKLKVGVLPTDTMYGLVGIALDPEPVEEIYRLRRRNQNKPMIILISSVEDIKLFDIEISKKVEKFLKKIWPNPVSVILPCLSERFTYLHRGKNSLAFRLPKREDLVELIKQTGPLVAPTANFESLPPSKDIYEARSYFGNEISFYVNEGPLDNPPSTLIRIINDNIEVLRQGAYKLSKNTLDG